MCYVNFQNYTGVGFKVESFLGGGRSRELGIEPHDERGSILKISTRSEASIISHRRTTAMGIQAQAK